MRNLRNYEVMRPGDRYEHYDVFGNPVIVEVVSESEPWTEPFGRAGFFRFWARRLDTGKEGWVCYGPGGTAVIIG